MLKNGLPLRAALGALLLFGVLFAPGASEPAQDWAIVGAKIYPSPTAQPILHGVVRIQNGKITAVAERESVPLPKTLRTLDGTGLIVTAGFWNSHVHFIEIKWKNAAVIPAPQLTQQLRAMLTRYGFTTVFDTGSPWENTKAIRQRIESGGVEGPRIFSAGEILWPKGGVPPTTLIKAEEFMLGEMFEVGTPQQGIERVRQKLAAGTDAIKIYAATWWSPIPVTMPRAVIQAITAEAHRQGKLVLAHPSNADGLEAALAGGVDVLVHTAPKAGQWNQARLSRMKQANIALIPTLKLWRVEAVREGSSPESVQRFVNAGVDQLRVYAAAGGPILFGTDVGYIDYDPTDEYRLMAQAGLSFPQILASLTTAPAERFGSAQQTGRVAPGMDADLVLLTGDPATEIRAFSRVRYTLRQGRIIYDAQSAN